MAGYRVIYEIDVSADSPEAAALEADATMRDPEAYPPIFTVRAEDGTEVDIDVAKIDAL